MIAYAEKVEGVERVEYSETIKHRFETSLLQSPIANVLYKPSEKSFAPWFLDVMDMVSDNCKRENVCDHTMAHLERSAQNGLVIADMLKNSPILKTSALDLENADLFSDESIIFTLFVHDLGYASNDILWQDHQAANHTEESVRIFDGLLDILQDLPDTHAAYGTYALLQPNVLAYQKAIAANTDDPSLFTSLIMAADKIDYFHTARIGGLPIPNGYRQNPYYFLAWMVKNYQLVYTKESHTLHYKVNVFGKKQLDAEEKQDRLNLWEEAVRKNFPQVFALVEDIAKIAGATFAIESL